MIDVLGFIKSNMYLEASIIILLSFLIAKLLLWFFKDVIEAVIKKRKEKYGSEFFLKVEHPLIFMIILVGIQLALNKISPMDITYYKLIRTAMVLVITYMLIGISHIFLKMWQSQHIKDNVAFHGEVLPLMKSLCKLTLIFIATIVILQLWGVKVMTLLTSLGIIGIILGFAFKDTMGNIFGGISLIMDDSIHKKDVIELPDGEKGEIIEINLRSTKIKTYDDDYLIVPNGILANTKFKNYNEPTPTHRLIIDFSVVYGSDVEKVKKVVLDSLKGNTDILKFPARSVRFDKMSEYSLNFKLYFYINDFSKMFEIKDEVTGLIYNALNKNKIEIPFPTRTIYTKKTKTKK